MTMVTTAPLKLRRELCDGIPNYVERTIDGRRVIEGLMQLQTNVLGVGMSWREEVCLTMSAKLDVAGRDGNPCTLATSVGLS
jgi:hypothetical protein